MGEEALRTPLFWQTLHWLSSCTKVDVLNSVINLDGTPIFEWHVVRCDSKMDAKHLFGI